MLHTIFIILHIGGAIVGAGGAFLSDILFLRSMRDGQISGMEMKSLLRMSKVVWTGIIILILSGILIFLEDPSKYLHSSKFLAKMSIVGIIVANGLVFRRMHIPHLNKHVNVYLPSSEEFMRRTPFLTASGALSGVSWFSALLLGLARTVPYSYATIMMIYASAVILAILAALTLRRYILQLP